VQLRGRGEERASPLTSATEGLITDAEASAPELLAGAALKESSKSHPRVAVLIETRLQLGVLKTESVERILVQFLEGFQRRPCAETKVKD
jgi:hypothetical protein